MPYYHVRITPSDPRQRFNDELALDLTDEQLERRFLAPRRQQRPVIVGGRTLAWDQIERIHINKTEEPSAELLPRIRAQRAGSRVISVITDGWYVTEEGTDVTDELITEPVGAQAPPAPEAGSWFHVRLAGGLLRQAHELNLLRDDVLRRFVAPWREGLQVSVEGKAFDPTKAKLMIPAGPRLTTNQLSMSRGWLNAIEFGEDVTDELLKGSNSGLAQAERVQTGRRRDPRAVAVFHGRDEQARLAMFGFLRDLDLRPLGWEDLVAATESASPYTVDVVDVAFELAQAVVVLFTPDDEARLHPDLWEEHEPDQERQLTTQPRANVIMETGMALMSHPDHTVIVEIGRLRAISNLAGRNTVRITVGNITGELNNLASRLENADCAVDRNSGDWLRPERFQNLTALHRKTSAAHPAKPQAVDAAAEEKPDAPEVPKQ